MTSIFGALVLAFVLIVWGGISGVVFVVLSLRKRKPTFFEYIVIAPTLLVYKLVEIMSRKR